MFLSRGTGWLAAIWGLVGAMTLLGSAVTRMSQQCIDAMSYDMSLLHIGVLVVWAFFMAYSEGYRGFQRGYSPRLAARALHLREHCTWLRFILAPLFCMGFFHTTRRRRITVIVLVVAITMMVILFRQLPQPWRGVLDFGVLIGLSWGIVATLVSFVRFTRAETVPFDAEVVHPVLKD